MPGCHFPIRKAKRALLGCIGRETGIPDGDGDLDGDVEISEFGHDEKNAILIGTVTVYYIQFLPTSMSSPTYKLSDLSTQYSDLRVSHCTMAPQNGLCHSARSFTRAVAASNFTLHLPMPSSESEVGFK